MKRMLGLLCMLIILLVPFSSIASQLDLNSLSTDQLLSLISQITDIVKERTVINSQDNNDKNFYNIIAAYAITLEKEALNSDKNGYSYMNIENIKAYRAEGYDGYSILFNYTFLFDSKVEMRYGCVRLISDSDFEKYGVAYLKCGGYKLRTEEFSGYFFETQRGYDDKSNRNKYEYGDPVIVDIQTMQIISDTIDSNDYTYIPV